MEHIPYYSGSLNRDEFMYQLEAIDNQFDYKEVQEEKRVSYDKTQGINIGLEEHDVGGQDSVREEEDSVMGEN